MFLQIAICKRILHVKKYPSKHRHYPIDMAKHNQLFYWRNLSDPKIRPDPRYFYFFSEKRHNKIKRLKAVLLKTLKNHKMEVKNF